MYPTTQNSRIFDAAPREGGIHIALADDYPVLLAGMRQSLAPCDDIVVVAECTRFSDLLSEVSLNKPEVILLGCDSNLENLSHQLHSIAELHADVKVIVFTGNVNVNFHEAALRNGAKGILLKQCSPEWIAKTVRKVSQGDLCFDPALTHRVLSTLVQRRAPTELPAAKAGISSLTGRENQIISRICQGMRNKEIASKLYISDATVAHHLTSIYRKLGLADRTELLLYAHNNGISTLKAS
jgi:two-component system nitrate/nitrite response regulator NarL